MRTLIALLAVTVLACGFLGYRVFVLERQVGELATAVGKPDDDAKKRKSPKRKKSSGLRDRVTALETAVADLRSSNELLAMKLKADTVSKHSVNKVVYSDKMAEQILDVVTEEGDRIIGKQLDWHKNNLVKSREAGVAQLAAVVNLTDTQRDSIMNLLTAETDRMVEVLKDPAYRENIDEAYVELRSVIRRTDEAVRPLLDEKQFESYHAGRTFEQLVIMPWALQGPS